MGAVAEASFSDDVRSPARRVVGDASIFNASLVLVMIAHFFHFASSTIYVSHNFILSSTSFPPLFDCEVFPERSTQGCTTHVWTLFNKPNI